MYVQLMSGIAKCQSLQFTNICRHVHILNITDGVCTCIMKKKTGFGNNYTCQTQHNTCRPILQSYFH